MGLANCSIILVINWMIVSTTWCIGAKCLSLFNSNRIIFKYGGAITLFGIIFVYAAHNS